MRLRHIARHYLGERDSGCSGAANIIGRGRSKPVEPPAAFVDDIRHHRRNHPPGDLIDGPPRLGVPRLHFNLTRDRTCKWYVEKSFERNETRTKPVVHIVREISDIVCKARDLRLGRRPLIEIERLPRFQSAHDLGNRRV